MKLNFFSYEDKAPPVTFKRFILFPHPFSCANNYNIIHSIAMKKIRHLHRFLCSPQHIHYVSNKHFFFFFPQLLEFLNNFFKHSGEVLTKLWMMLSWIVCVTKKHLTPQHTFPPRQCGKSKENFNSTAPKDNHRTQAWQVRSHQHPDKIKHSQLRSYPDISVKVTRILTGVPWDSFSKRHHIL